ncbi:MAG: signal peptide peptidase SppA, partial [Verrucomicrobia bacterium]|nr:signal peptide peptidase SppA [Verrucomicrobiota bacterium]
IERFKKLYGEDKQANTFRQVTISSYLDAVEGTNRDKTATGPRVAIVYAEGDIVDGEGSPGEIGGDKYAREIRKLRVDPSVKAIVLRVNSPGGSAFASEQIYRELKTAQAAKPVVVSMGAYAASGGYYIASASNRIFAEPTTITGSIGVFGMLVNFQKIANANGITTDSVVTTTPLASLFTPFVQKPESDLTILQKSVDKFYEQFLSRVSSGRQMPVQQVNDLAQGRVWSGVEAEKLKLVDQFGGLMNAVDYVSQQTGLGANPRVFEFPERKNLGEKIKEIMNAVPRPPVSRANPATLLIKSIEHELSDLKWLNDPENIYARIPVNIGWN